MPTFQIFYLQVFFPSDNLQVMTLGMILLFIFLFLRWEVNIKLKPSEPFGVLDCSASLLLNTKHPHKQTQTRQLHITREEHWCQCANNIKKAMVDFWKQNVSFFTPQKCHRLVVVLSLCGGSDCSDYIVTLSLFKDWMSVCSNWFSSPKIHVY